MRCFARFGLIVQMVPNRVTHHIWKANLSKITPTQRSSIYVEFPVFLTFLTLGYAYMCAYQAVWNVAFSENLKHVLNEWFHNKNNDSRVKQNVQWQLPCNLYENYARNSNTKYYTYSTHLLIRTRKGHTFLFELTNVRINQNWGKIGIFAKYKRNIFFSIRKFEHFNIRTLVTTYIMEALWIKNGTMAVHLRR